MANSPTSRTLTELRDSGYIAQVVERFNSFAKVRVDLFGIIDIIVLTPANMGPGRIIGVQACAGASHAARRDKSLAEPRLAEWLRCGGKYQIWSWSQRGAKGKRKRWEPRVERFELRGGVVSPISGENATGGDLNGSTGESTEELVSLDL